MRGELQKTDPKVGLPALNQSVDIIGPFRDASCVWKTRLPIRILERRMRWFAWSLMAVCAFTIGCNAPVETVPSVASPTSSGTTGEDSHEGHDHAEGEGHGEAEHGGEAHSEEGHSEEGKAEESNSDAAAETTSEGESSEPAPAGDASSSTTTATPVRFVADKKLEVPGMQCPYSCWPKVQETLAAQPGVEGVQLAEQPEGTPEGEIKTRVVELKLAEGFDVEGALAALKAVDFEATAVN